VAARAVLCDEILIHLALYLLGGGVPLSGALPDGIRLEKALRHWRLSRNPSPLSGNRG
jgi:hypothetical protein